AGGVEPAARAGRGARDPARRVHADGRPPARPGRRGAEGRPVGGDRDRGGARVAPVPPPGAPRRGDDRGADAARAGAADRRAQGEAHRRGPRWRAHGARARAQQERPRGRAGRSEEAARDQAGGHAGRSIGARAARGPPVAAGRRARPNRPAAGSASVSEFATLAEAFAQIRRHDGRYHERGYMFVLAALEYAQSKLPARRHLSGAELAWACRDFALEQFGLLAPTVLAHWDIRSTEDLGRIVFQLIDVGLLARQPTDKLEDFERVYDFAEVFRAGYRWSGVERAR